eukprot:140356_1
MSSFSTCWLLLVSCRCASLSQWTISSAVFPSGSTATRAICGYNFNTWRLHILEGTNSISYDVTSNEFSTHSPLPISISSDSQGYAQFDNYLYFVHDYSIGAFNMDTEQMQYPLSTQLLSAKTHSCLTISQDGAHLFILGGKDATKAIINTFQIYDIETQTLVTGPQKVEKTNCCTSSSCTVIDDQLYWFGGYKRNNPLQNVIEVIDVSNIANIASKSWQILTYFSQGRRFHKSVLFNALIYNIGGQAQYMNATGAGTATATNLVEMFDPNTKQIEVDTPLPETMGYPCVVTGNDVIFVTKGQSLYWTTSDGVTLNRTTNHPSIDPTVQTIDPSVNPTNAPSHIPSLQPTFLPTSLFNNPTTPEPTRRLHAVHNSPTYSPQSNGNIASTAEFKGQSTDAYGQHNTQSTSQSVEVEWIVIASIIGSLFCVAGILACIIFSVRKRTRNDSLVQVSVLSKHVEANGNSQLNNVNLQHVQEGEEVMAEITLGGSALHSKEESDHDDDDDGIIAGVNTLGDEGDALDSQLPVPTPSNNNNAKRFVSQAAEDEIIMGDDETDIGTTIQLQSNQSHPS